MKSALRLFVLLLGWAAFRPPTAQAQCTTATVNLDYRTSNTTNTYLSGDWRNRPVAGAPNVASATQVSTAYTSNDTNSTLATGTLNGQTLSWSADYTSTTNNTSTVTYTFSRPVSNLTVRVQDIDAVLNSPFLQPTNGFTDQVTFAGLNGTTTVTPTLTRANAVTTYTTIAANVATGLVTGGNNTTTDDATVIATYGNAVTSITLTYRNVTTASTINNQSVGIDLMTWCRITPTASDVTTTTIPSSAGQTGISSLVGAADGVPTYIIASLPNQGTLFYNSTGTTYAAVALNQTLTAAQAASLRYTPSTTFTGTSTSFTYRVRDDAGLNSTTATYTIPLQYIAPCATSTTTLSFGGRTVGEDWKTHAAEGVPAGSTATLISSGGYSNGAATTSTFQVAAVNGVNSLRWNNDYSTGSTNTSQVTFTYTRPVANFTVQVQDIDANAGFTDQVVFSGANGGATITPTLTAANPGAGVVSVSGNTAQGQNATGSPVDGTVTAYFASPISSLTLTYNNTTNAADPGNQLVGINQMTWCSTLPTAVDVTSAALLSSVGAASISGLSSLADNVPVASYTLTSIPTPAQGVLSYNSGGTTYTNITAANQVLTAAQAAILNIL